MNNNSKRRPFYQVFIGIFCILLTAGSLLGIIGRIILPEQYPTPVITSILFFGLFLILAIAFLEPVKEGTEAKRKKESSKIKMSFLRAAVFIVVWAGMAFLGNLCFPAKNAAGAPVSSSGSLALSFLGIVLGIVAAYFCPIPQKWREGAKSNEGNKSDTAVGKIYEEPEAIAHETIHDDGRNSDNKSVIYEKEDITL